MEQAWLENNVDKFTIEQIEILEYYAKGRQFTAVGGFLFGMFPQYNLLAIESMKPAGKARVIRQLGLLIIPFCTSYIASRPYTYFYDSYVKDLKKLYPETQ